MLVNGFAYAFLLCLCATFGESYDSKAIRVIDGDTIKITMPDGEQERIRIVGIDAAETRRTGRAKGQAKAQGMTLDQVIEKGKAARLALAKIHDGETVTIVEAYQPAKRDRYGRRLCYLEVDDRDVCELLLRAGDVWRYERFKHPRLERYQRAKNPEEPR